MVAADRPEVLQKVFQGIAALRIGVHDYPVARGALTGDEWQMLESARPEE